MFEAGAVAGKLVEQQMRSCNERGSLHARCYLLCETREILTLGGVATIYSFIKYRMTWD